MSSLSLSNIPVIHPDAWTTVMQRLRAPSIQFTKRMDVLYETTKVPKIFGMCSFVGSHPPIIRFTKASEFKRLKHFDHEMCRICYSKDLRVDSHEGTKICARCGFVADESVRSDESSSYTQGFATLTTGYRQKQSIPRRHSSSSYKRCNHFKEILLRLQGKEKCFITKEEMSLVRSEIKIRSLHVEDLTGEALKKILRYLGLAKYYNNVYYLIKEITGDPLITLSNYHFNELFQDFVKVQEHFIQFAPRRSNMMSYMYVIRKLCEIRGWHDIAKSIPHLKCTSKIIEQDIIWKQICAQVNFPFIRSLF